MRRREFIALMGASATWPFAATAQEPGRTYRLGCLFPAPRDNPANAAWFDELKRRGFIEGQNLTVEYRAYGQRPDLLPQYAAELVKARVDVIAIAGDEAVRAVQQATKTIPIVAFAGDLLESGLGSDSLNPPCERGGEADGGQIVARQSVVSCGDAPEVFQPIERTLDPPAQLVETLVEAERVLSVGVVWNDRRGSALVECLTQSVAVISRVAEHMFRRRHSSDQALGNRVVVRLTAGQQNGEEAPLSICKCVYLRVAPSARAANSLLLLPPFPPAAERCALTCVELIICVSADRPHPASSRNRFSQMPRRAQRTKRL